MKKEHVEEREAFFESLNNDPNVQLAIANSMNAVLEDLE